MQQFLPTRVIADAGEQLIGSHLYELWGVEWDPLGNDVALLTGRLAPLIFGSPTGIVLRIGANDAITSTVTGVDETLYDVTFKPGGEYAVICSGDGAMLRHAADGSGSYRRFDAATSPAVPGSDLRGVDFRPNRSHAASVGLSEKIVRYQERLDL